MHARILLLTAFGLLVACSGCLSELDSDGGGPDDGPTVTKGDPLDTLAFQADGSFPASVEVLDASLEIGCGNLGTDRATHVWDIPTTSDAGVPQQIKSATITLHETSASSLDVDLFVYDDAGNLLGSSTTSDLTGDDADTVLLGDLPAGSLLIDVRGCLGVGIEYRVDGSAAMVASEDVFGAPVAPVTVRQQGDRWVAERIVQYEKDVTAATGQADVSSGAGFVAVTQGGTGYHLKATLKGYGDTEQEARDRLDAIRLEHRVTDGAILDVDVHARTDDGNWNNQEADLAFTIQDLAWTSLDAGTSAGAVRLDGLHGTFLGGHTSAGSVSGRGLEADSIKLSTSAGGVELTNSRADDVQLTASAGGILADLNAATGSGTWRLQTSAGAIDLRLAETAGNGYDVDGRTSAGDIQFQFSDMATTASDCEYASCHKHATTDGYDSRAVQTLVDLDTSAGFIGARS